MFRSNAMNNSITPTGVSLDCHIHYVEYVPILNYSGQNFLAFGLNIEISSLDLRI